MSAKDTGGPAYPGIEFIRNEAFPSQPIQKGVPGMTLRDAFALAALPEVLREWREDREKHDASADFDSDAPLVADDCYIVADAMLEARKK